MKPLLEEELSAGGSVPVSPMPLPFRFRYRLVKSFPYPSPAPFLFQTRRLITERYHEQRNHHARGPHHRLGDLEHKDTTGITVIPAQEVIEQDSFENQLKKHGIMILSCAYFDPSCAHSLDEHSLSASFLEYYRDPQLYPSVEFIAEQIRDTQFKELLKKRMMEELRELRKGRDVGLPSVAILFNGTINDKGSLLTDEVFLPSWLDSQVSPFHFQDNHHAKKVKEVVVISHIHHGMYWHQLVNEFFRVFALLPYLWAHLDIHLHLSSETSDYGLMVDLYEMIGISKTRLVFETVTADIIYYTHQLHRDQVPSLTLSWLIRENLLKIFNASDSNTSGLLCKNNKTPSEVQTTVKILLIHRDARSKTGRAILNHDELVQSLSSLRIRCTTAINSSDSFKSDIKVDVSEHTPSMRPRHSFPLYASAGMHQQKQSTSNF